MKSSDFTEFVKPKVLAEKKFNKVFCIGYNKTGTTTLQTVFQLYGYRVPDQKVQEMRLTKNVFRTDYKELQQFCQYYDGFQDMPFSQGMTYVAVDALFPESRFILTERPPEEWFESLVSFQKKFYNLKDLSRLKEEDIKKRFNYLYPGYAYENHRRNLSVFTEGTQKVLWEKLYDYDYYVDIYLRRNEEIKRYFMNAPEKLLVIDVTKEKDTARICEFLGIPKSFSIKMPHSNKTDR